MSDITSLPFGAAAESEDEDENLEEEDENLDEEVLAEQGDICSDCGERFTESNGSPALCKDCYDAADDQGVTPDAPLSKFPLA